MKLPHNFPSLIDVSSTQTKPVLIIGAGMSHGIVPMVAQLTEHVRDNQNDIENELGCNSSFIFNGQDKDLYRWADIIIYQLINTLNLSQLVAKKKLMAAINVLGNDEFYAKINIPLRGNTARHRVVARLAREGRLDVIWSLNWDVVLEAALNSVGLIYSKSKPTKERLPVNWPEWYTTWTQPDRPVPNNNKLLRVMKPHGCVRKLENGNDTFLITESELDSINGYVQTHHALLTGDFNVKPLVAVGWRASERYIRNILKQCYMTKTLGLKNVEDNLSIIDIEKSRRSHDVVMGRYEVDDTEAMFLVNLGSECPTTDDLFLWIQTRFGFNCLIVIHDKGGLIESGLSEMFALFSEPNCSHWANKWFDSFLPIWVLLCFKSEKVVFRLAAQPIATNVIPTYRRDEHIPWCDSSANDRDDLRSASLFLLAIYKSKKVWDFEKFPGGLWDSVSKHLVIPIPAWEPDKNVNFISLKSLSSGWHWRDKGIIKKVSILPLYHDNGENKLEDNVVGNWKLQVALLMKSSALAQQSNVGMVNLQQIENTE